MAGCVVHRTTPAENVENLDGFFSCSQLSYELASYVPMLSTLSAASPSSEQLDMMGDQPSPSEQSTSAHLGGGHVS